ncbi:MULTISPECIES: sulfate ABC transporter substrate-binding protein [Rhodomicrobium]|uniref:sulfate ABC transporter substrate-binding protein n=1 Tax=Rhodomicrobium TaxID=1068 RepID=UPI000B4BBFF6|nr:MULTISPECIES: sulfate ABC transporter substrate-binding protein [Rhodomicrobium]
MLSRVFSWAGFVLAFVFLTAYTALAQTTILNVSYDVSRELYKQINPAFIDAWKAKTGETVTVNQSHGGSSKQAASVAEGLDADVITMNQAPDIDFLADKGLVAKDWKSKFPNDAAPYTSVSVFLVRKGNPKGIKDWSDLAKPGISVIVPNPKTSGNGRYTYLAAWGYALENLGGADAAKDFVKKLFGNVPVFDGGGRGATTTFSQRDVGDALVTFENEARLIAVEFGADKFDIVYPSLSVEAPAPVAINEKVVDKKKTREVATAYLNFLYSPEGQAIIAKYDFRPRDEAVLRANQAKFPPVKTFDVEKLIGSWADVRKTHFADGGIYDQISVK